MKFSAKFLLYLYFAFASKPVLGQIDQYFETEQSLEDYFREEPRLIFRAGLWPGISVEQNISPKVSFIYRLNLGFQYISTTDTYRGTRSESAFFPILSFRPRKYITFERRLRIGKSIYHRSGTYLSFPVTYIPETAIAFGGIMIGPTIGHQINFGKRFYFDIEGGLGILLSNETAVFDSGQRAALGQQAAISIGINFN
jgi:hypothetical protein